MKISNSFHLPLNNQYKIKPQQKSDCNNIAFGETPDNTYIHNDKEYEYAKKYLGQEDWETDYFNKRLSEIHKFRFSDHLDEDLYAYINAFFILIPLMVDTFILDDLREKHVKKVIAPEIRRIKEIMFQLNNEKLREIETQKKEYSADLHNLQKDKDAKNDIYENFLKPLNNNDNENIIVPTAIMIEGSDKQARKDILNWTKEQITQRPSEFTLPVNEDDALYRITTEIDYAQDYYNKTGKRTVMFIEDFANILNPSKVSDETITEMKAILSDIAEEQSPCSIVFDIDDETKLDKAFTGNRVRIPLRIKLTK